MYNAIRYHDFCAGHRVYKHESKCKHLHGHNYRAHFYCRGDLDSVGRVIDFSVIKSTLCQWLEDNYDHRMLIWENDPLLPMLSQMDEKLLAVPYNPTAENMAQFLVEFVAPDLLSGTGIECYKVVIEETRKCSASYEI